MISPEAHRSPGEDAPEAAIAEILERAESFVRKADPASALQILEGIGAQEFRKRPCSGDPARLAALLTRIGESRLRWEEERDRVLGQLRELRQQRQYRRQEDPPGGGGWVSRQA
jgi:hypothetical protein